jgi:hypothetical protein
MSKQNNQTLSVHDSSSTLYPLGEGNNDTVTATYSSSMFGNDTFKLGNGNNDAVTVIASGVCGTIILGDGNNDTVSVSDGKAFQITLGDGQNDTVAATGSGGGNKINLGNGNHDTVFSAGNVSGGGLGGDQVTVGKGNDTIHVGISDTVTVGTGHGHDVFAFDWNPSAGAPLNQGPDQSTPGGIGNVTITGFNANKDVIVLQQKLATDFNHLSITSDGSTGSNITIDSQDQIHLVGVAPSALHQSDFHFV